MAILKADCSSGSEAYVYKAFAEQTDAWFTLEVWAGVATLDAYQPNWDASGSLLQILDDTNDLADAYYLGDGDLLQTFLEYSWSGDYHDEDPIPETWQLLEVHVAGGAPLDFYVDGTLVDSSSWNLDVGVKPDRIYVGQRYGYLADPASIVYIDNVKVGTTRGGSEIFSDDFEDNTLDAWDATSGDVSVIDDVPSSSAPTEIPVVEITRDGATPETAVDSNAADGMFITGNDGRILVEIVSEDAGAQTVGFSITETIDDQPAHDKTVTVPAGARRVAGPFPEWLYNQPDGSLQIHPSVDATLKLRAYACKRDVIILDG
jgi:hypothetical protein